MPCRLGSRYVEQVFAEKVGQASRLPSAGALPVTREAGETPVLLLKDCEKVISALKLTSLCGLGTGLAEFAESALRHYGKELELCWR